MDVPVIHRFNDFQLGLNSLQSSSVAGIQSVSIAYNFCKWGAVILALVATFGSIISKVKILIIKFRRKTHSLSSIPLLSELDDDEYSSSDDEGTYASSSSPSSDFEEDEDDPAAASSSYFKWRGADEDFGAEGSGHHTDDQLQSGNVRLRRRRSIGDIFSLSEIANSQSVVKLWDSIGFGLGLDFDDGESTPWNVISIYDVDKERSIGFVPGGNPPIPATSSSSAAVVVSAGANESGNLALKIWDTRLRRRIPAVIAEWGPHLGRIIGVRSGGVEKVYVSDDASYGVTVGDMRKASSPLANVTESDVDNWWDASDDYGDDSVSQRK